MSPIKYPATAGPKNLPRLKMVEFNAMAFGRSSLPTSSMKKDCLVGTSRVFTIPRSVARINTCQYSTVPVHVSVARIAARMAKADWVYNQYERFGNLSASVPAQREIGLPVRIGPLYTMLNFNAELVISKTSQA